MIGPQYEYLFLLLIVFCLTMAIAPNGVAHLLKTPKVWCGCTLFAGHCVIMEKLALASGWWVFSTRRLCGVELWGIPIEEYLIICVDLLFDDFLLDDFNQ